MCGFESFEVRSNKTDPKCKELNIQILSNTFFHNIFFVVIQCFVLYFIFYVFEGIATVIDIFEIAIII